ncbi:hypothetical protein NOCARDAX2BIS_600045 [Nocardioides sp. AX2bis]|nr:hypothetical protein NOCARDAX2BIS_600045 [Nocardioides sp. AX2bis]
MRIRPLHFAPDARGSDTPCRSQGVRGPDAAGRRLVGGPISPRRRRAAHGRGPVAPW